MHTIAFARPNDCRPSSVKPLLLMNNPRAHAAFSVTLPWKFRRSAAGVFGLARSG